jgi:proton glutamate symport protein
MKKFGLATQIFIAYILGIVVGALLHRIGTAMAIMA